MALYVKAVFTPLQKAPSSRWGLSANRGMSRFGKEPPAPAGGAPPQSLRCGVGVYYWQSVFMKFLQCRADILTKAHSHLS